MRLWNGWGDDSVTPHVPVGLAAALKANVGEGPVPADATWAQVTASVPGSRAALHPLVSTDVGERVRRTRLGPVLRDGGEAIFPGVQRVVTEELGWDAARWEQELARYRETWKAQHAMPAAA